MPRPKIKKVTINLVFMAHLREGGDTLDSILVDKLKELQTFMGFSAVEDLLKVLVREAFKSGWPESAIQTLAVAQSVEPQAVESLTETEDSNELDLEIPSFLNVSLT